MGELGSSILRGTAFVTAEAYPLDSLGRLALRYVAERRLRGELTDRSCETVRNVLGQFADQIGDRPPNKVTRRRVERWRDSMEVSASTVRNRISIVRTFFDWCVEQRLCRSNPLAGLRSPKEPRRLPRGLTRDEVTAILRECPDERATLIVLLECQECLRAMEVAGVQRGDINRTERELRIVGKGGHERMVPVSDETWEALNRYLTAHPGRTGPLIRSYTRPGDGIKPGTVVRLIGEVMKAAGVDESGHSLRHTGATDMLRNGADLIEVRDALGHRSISTTEQYTGVTRASQLREAMGGRRYGRGPWSVN